MYLALDSAVCTDKSDLSQYTYIIKQTVIQIPLFCKKMEIRIYLLSGNKTKTIYIPLNIHSSKSTKY